MSVQNVYSITGKVQRDQQYSNLATTGTETATSFSAQSMDCSILVADEIVAGTITTVNGGSTVPSASLNLTEQGTFLYHDSVPFATAITLTGNTFIGDNAGNTTLTGSNNAVFGSGAGVGLTTGSSNTIIGQGAAPALAGGSSNVIIGTGASAAAGVTGAIALGAGVVAVTGALNLGGPAQFTITGTDPPTAPIPAGAAGIPVTYNGGSTIYYLAAYT
eukprot:gnl/Hemi2/24199_TR8118_c0_g1_i1.p1 gnl/Hemi2/24199_TR8118_c0_g1~~gnl/Hemi2/24199_TR8118_c0_g1_i1.p1  ORF type:complete len:218 (+),score=54.08 gnl/Hemi2/24199_TR8118_c0_g1_i1:14-667(+)